MLMFAVKALAFPADCIAIMWDQTYVEDHAIDRIHAEVDKLPFITFHYMQK